MEKMRNYRCGNTVITTGLDLSHVKSLNAISYATDAGGLTADQKASRERKPQNCPCDSSIDIGTVALLAAIL